jgi:hypothetical protein
LATLRIRLVSAPVTPLEDAQLAGDELQQVLLVVEERLHDDVVAAGGDAHVADLLVARSPASPWRSRPRSS